ncbi:YciI family protein [Amycolatopsis rhabdoformis]|uniref:YciI family protein n=1 Tax=Amycolatopsis rhabdoformis TaxID=1448059 RepID=A0ABZ1I6J8_9PSEU|nr:YciI family protein [Amycolatopsis rhabdoformis]WSE29945.1 YciI family protein [Amycolatopsis rhabdoformis]
MAQGTEANLYYACFTDPANADSAAERSRQFDAHKAWLKEHEADILVAGPLLAESLEPAGSGLIVFRTESADAARRLAEADPMHASGARTFRIVPWRINEGTLTARLTVSTGSFDLT